LQAKPFYSLNQNINSGVVGTYGMLPNVKPIFQEISGDPQYLVGDNTKMIDLLVKPSRRIEDYLCDITI
jgi:hypothetical protein